jgi:hypothetical protein
MQVGMLQLAYADLDIFSSELAVENVFFRAGAELKTQAPRCSPDTFEELEDEMKNRMIVLRRLAVFQSGGGHRLTDPPPSVSSAASGLPPKSRRNPWAEPGVRGVSVGEREVGGGRGI